MSRLLAFALVLALLLVSWYVVTQFMDSSTTIISQPGEGGEENGGQPAAALCGDGTIQAPNSAGLMEECEVGVGCVEPNEKCNLDSCMCEPQEEAAEETHAECDASGACIVVAGAGWSHCNIDADCAGDADGMHTECTGEFCLLIPGPGLDECTTDDECAGGAEGTGVPGGTDSSDYGDAEGTGGGEEVTHMECISRLCLPVPGPGADVCIANDECAGEVFHTQCVGGMCSEVEGPGGIECIADSDCIQEEGYDGMHNACVGGECTAVEGEGLDECQFGFQCSHYECTGASSCQLVLSPGENECYVDYECEGTYNKCENGECVNAFGEGRDECYVDAECEFPTHRVCILDDCVEIEGAGQDECYVNDECTLVHFECQGEQCVLVEGGGKDECYFSEDCEVVDSPDLDCEYICGQTPGAELIAQRLPGINECNLQVEEHYLPQTCYTTCRYRLFYRVDNMAGYDSCCCGMVERFPCDDCPGQNPTCSDPENTCSAATPSWYEPI